MKNTWQAVFLPSVLIYTISLLHLFYIRPTPGETASAFINNIDLVSYIIAIVLTVSIFNLKRKYFSKKFCRIVVEDSLKRRTDQSDELLLKQVFAILRKKMLIVWLLGFLVILDGVIFYWVTFSDRNNMHIYFIIGVFSLFINYPRSELFGDLPWYVLEGRKEIQNQ